MITSGNDPQRQPAASKKANKDLGAEEYYRIFKSSQRNKDEEVEKSTSSSAEAKKSVSSQEENERVVEAAEDDDEEEEDKDDADVGHESVESNEMDGTKVQGGIAERREKKLTKLALQIAREMWSTHPFLARLCSL